MEILFRKKSVVFRCMCLIFQMFFFEQLNLGIISMYLFYSIKMKIIQQSLIQKCDITISKYTRLIQFLNSTYLPFIFLIELPNIYSFNLVIFLLIRINFSSEKSGFVAQFYPKGRRNLLTSKFFFSECQINIYLFVSSSID